VRENLAITRLSSGAETVRADAFTFLEAATRAHRRYDIVYVAPPQYAGMAARAVARLDAAPLTDPGGLVIAQTHPRERGDLDALSPRRLRLADERRYGSTLLIFYEHRDDARGDGVGAELATGYDGDTQEHGSHDERDE